VAVCFIPAGTTALSADAQEGAADVYRYHPEEKPDPFKPFVTIVTEEKEGEEKKVSVPRSPLEKFVVGEFRLTGILWTGTKKIAIVRSPDGKRHLLQRGTAIGINEGKVIEIRHDGVVILEKVKDFAGNTKEERIILALQKNREHP
jgi:type IV pilus assembly protein PilP